MTIFTDTYNKNKNIANQQKHLNPVEMGFIGLTVGQRGDQDMKDLVKPANEAEANVIRSILAENGISAEVKSFHDTAYDGLFQAQYGWGLIRVSESDFAQAQKILQEWQNAAPEELPWQNDV